MRSWLFYGSARMVGTCSNKFDLVGRRVDLQHVVCALRDAVDAAVGRVDEAPLVLVLAIAQTAKRAHGVGGGVYYEDFVGVARDAVDLPVG